VVHKEKNMSSFTKNLKEGDIILAYKKGIHIVTRVERRFVRKVDIRYDESKAVGDEYSGLIYYRQLARANGKKIKSKREWCCDAHYCRPLDDSWFQEQLDVLEEKRRLIAELREEFRK
jgi:hypothetical protein